MTEACTIERYLNRPDWLAARNTGIGASDAAAIVGLSGYASPYSVWVHKTEPVVIDEMDDLAYWGLRLEPIIADEFWRQAKDAIRND